MCALAKDMANNTLSVDDYEHSGEDGLDQATVNPDGSVTVTDFSVKYVKMFHRKTRANGASRRGSTGSCF